ncbi:MAG: tRNA (adenosine(37)-N6)-dimethylallyltransferase MiaA [Sutterellaceae bacterium]|nr:tRNA (adenosine(37)-N6)-dimethylallyltransferase MiaA [Sutterellaceae bacterium]MDD7441908.1 tRNA (adenosine(37)-N6)-dimethylallyltransferase MiaA [Sutterellaceae bacterium]MDY2867434.1 tRNA (adenosine(37)-N6)-dimethylallyltransferase MiaA [Mesosutterella sp.]
MSLDALMILGPTASGKTALSLEIAKRIPSEVISVDSALVYRGMDIGTAKPDAAERGNVPHHLIDIRGIGEPYSVADFVADSSRLIPEIRSRGRLPILAGGTMLYANALLKGLAELPATDPVVRESVAREGEEKGWPAMREALRAVDPETADRLKPNDRQRISRAIEVYRMTGRPMSAFIAEQERKGPPFALSVIALIPGDRSELHRRIAERFDGMLRSGFLDEMRRLMKEPGYDPLSSAMRSVGYRQAIEHLGGMTTAGEFRDKAVAATRQLAKRQITWLRSMKEKRVFDPFEPGGLQRAADYALSLDWGLPRGGALGE